jgi:hypothetical protein
MVFFMGEWVIVILLACVSSEGISENKEVGFGFNPKGEMIILSPPMLDLHLKKKKRLEDVTIMSDENNHLYSIKSNLIDGKFIFIINELETVKVKYSNNIELDTYRSLSSMVISTADPQANRIVEENISMDTP